MVRIEMENGGIIDIELYEDKAPITVKNFLKLVGEGFYDGLIFHRVISGFMIQGGDPTGTGCGGSDENIKGEFMANGFKNDISHVRGVVSMARSQNPNSASSQFFIMHADGKFLDGQYAAFGKVVSGLEVVDEIADVKTDFRDRPIVDMRMKKVSII
ncbi:MAG: peptidylprolyl isomerase [Clostridia bacterium]|nr:peptidylprolyl isomerase [Clostridia bacterium]